MPVSNTVWEVLVEFTLSFIKLLSRPAVQLQLLAAAAAILLASLLARLTTGVLDRRHQARLQRLRNEIIAEQTANHSEDGSSGEGHELLLDEAALEDAVEKRSGLGRRFYLLIVHLIFPIIVTVLLYATYVLFVAQGWYDGLLADITILAGIYLFFRFLVGLAYALGSPERVRHYDQRLFVPLFVVIVVLLGINTVIDIRVAADATLFRLEDGWLTLGAVFVATVGFYFWIVLLALLKDLIGAALRKRGQINAGSLDAGLTLAQYGMIALGLFGVFQVLQFNAATVAAITGGLSVGIGFGLQDVFKNFLGGIIVLFEGSVRPGDFVEISGTEGHVDKLSIRSTVVRTYDNIEYIVPNQDWLSSTIKTYTRNSRRVRTSVPIGVSYDADPRFVQQLLVETALSHPDVLHEPSPAAALVNFGASSIDFVVLAWVDDVKLMGKVAGDLRFRIWDALKANGIEMPFPQQDIHIRSGPPSPLRDGGGDSTVPSGAASS